MMKAQSGDSQIMQIDRDIDNLMRIGSQLQNELNVKMSEVQKSSTNTTDPIDDMIKRMKSRNDQIRKLKQQLRKTQNQLENVRTSSGVNIKIAQSPNLSQKHQQEAKRIQEKKNKLQQQRQRVESQSEGYCFFLIRVIDQLSKANKGEQNDNNTVRVPKSLLIDILKSSKDDDNIKQIEALIGIKKQSIQQVVQKPVDQKQLMQQQKENYQEQLKQLAEQLKEKSSEQVFGGIAKKLKLQKIWNNFIQNNKERAKQSEEIRAIIKQVAQKSTQGTSISFSNLNKIEEDVTANKKMERIFQIIHISAQEKRKFEKYKTQKLVYSGISKVMKSYLKNQQQGLEWIQKKTAQKLVKIIAEIYGYFFTSLINFVNSKNNFSNPQDLPVAFDISKKISNKSIMEQDYINKLKKQIDRGFGQVKRLVYSYNYREINLKGK